MMHKSEDLYDLHSDTKLKYYAYSIVAGFITFLLLIILLIVLIVIYI